MNVNTMAEYWEIQRFVAELWGQVVFRAFSRASHRFMAYVLSAV
jgi:hypothetical protein